MRRVISDSRPRLGIALLVVAAVLALSRLVEGVAGGTDLPDPEQAIHQASGRRTAEELVEFWSDRVEDRPDVVDSHVRLAKAHMTLAAREGDLELHELAERTARSALELDPTDVEARLTLARSLANQHAFRAALQLADELLQEDPSSVGALLVAGDALTELGNRADAEAAFRRAGFALGGNPPELLSRFARLGSLRGDTPEAVRLARRALVASGDQDLDRAGAAFYWFQLASYEFRIGEIDAAAEQLRTALQIDPGNLGATELLARVEAARGDTGAAISLYRHLIERGPAADLHGELAKLYRRDGRAGEAAAEIQAGLRLAARSADRFPAERRHLIGFLADHDPAEALRLAELDARSRPDLYSQAWLAWSMLQTGDVDGALTTILPVVDTAIDDPQILYQAGAILGAAGRPEHAADLLARALDINPVFDVEHADRARVLLERYGHDRGQAVGR